MAALRVENATDKVVPLNFLKQHSFLALPLL